MKRTRAQIRRSLNELATDLTVSGHRGYAKRLRRYTTELSGRDTLIAVTASLAAAISLLEHTPHAAKAAPSNRMFYQMIIDYKRALAKARAELAEIPKNNPRKIKLSRTSLANIEGLGLDGRDLIDGIWSDVG